MVLYVKSSDHLPRRALEASRPSVHGSCPLLGLFLLVLLLVLLLLWRLLFCALLLLLFLLLYVLLYFLFLLLRLPLFLLAGSANMDPRRSQNRPPGGAQMASWRPLELSWARGRPQVAARAAFDFCRRARGGNIFPNQG